MISSANDVLIDFLEDNRRRLHRVLAGMPDACLHWTSGSEANSIAVTVWHMGRLFDVFLTCQALGKPATEECWFRRGWADTTGYDPRGLGRNGWGSLNDYTPAEVAAIPRFSPQQLLGYFDDVMDAATSYLRNTSASELQALGQGSDRRFTQYQWIQMALLDNTRHLGEIFALQAMWERQSGETAGSAWGP